MRFEARVSCVYPWALFPNGRKDITAVGEKLRAQPRKCRKVFSPAASGWRALLHPISRLTVPALRGISFEVKQGEVLALVGANGAGKSTLLRILTTLLIPTRGNAQVCGFDVAREPAKVRLQIGYHTGADACFYSRLSARENLLLFAGLNNLSVPRPHAGLRSSLARSGSAICSTARCARFRRETFTGWVWRAPCFTGLRYCFSMNPREAWIRSRPPNSGDSCSRILLASTGRR